MLEGLIGVLVLVTIIMLGFPIAFAFALVGFAGIAYLAGPSIALATFKEIPFWQTLNYELSAIIMFVFMAYIAFKAGISEELFGTVYTWIGHVRGSLAMTACISCGAFAAISGSSVATATTMAVVALPEMKRYNYHPRLSTGSLAAGGTVGILIPPSIPLLVYGVFTLTSIGRLFMAGLIPGILEVLSYVAVIYIMTLFKPHYGPRAQGFSWKERFVSLKGTIGMLLLFVLVMGGIYGGIFTPTEAGAIGAFGSIVILIARGKLNWPDLKVSLIETGMLSGMIFIIVIGAMIFNRFIVFTGLTNEVTHFLTTADISPITVILFMLVTYLFLGCIMDPLAMLTLTVPIYYPIVQVLGFSLIWFGVLVVRMMEIGMITPPVGLNLFAIKGVVREEVPFSDIMIGVLPFLAADFVIVALLVKFPALSLFIPSTM